LENEWQTVKEISIVSELSWLSGEHTEETIKYVSDEIEGFVVHVQPATGEKCSRCWIRSTTVGQNEAHPEICDRCSDVVAEMGL
jgi:isoleucyl-tRNA synthetase